MKDFYYILGADINSSYDEIKEAYRKLSKKFHPDLNPDDEYFETQFRQINEAYEILSDPVKRKKYDSALKKANANPIDEEFERRRQQTGKYEPYKRRSVTYRFKRGPGVGTSILLIVVGLIFAAYLVKSFSNSKLKTVRAVVTTPPVYKTIRKHHKKKHLNQNIPKDTISTIFKDTNQINTDAIGKPPAVLSKKSSQPPIIQDSPRFLYSTYIHANITGIVNLREADYYGSPVIGVIPADSRVDVLEKGNVYYKISYNDNVGYVPKWALEKR